MSLDRNSDRPLYKQLADMLRAQILSGELAEGSVLPSKAQLAEQHRVSITGVVEPALAELKAGGLILMRRGYPTQVLPVRIDVAQQYAAARHGYQPDVESNFAREHGIPWSAFGPNLERRYITIPAPAIVAEFLELPPDEPVVERTWIHRIEGVATRLAKSYLQESKFGGTPLCDPHEPPHAGGTIEMLTALGLNPENHLLDIGWRKATNEECELFQSAADDGMLEQWRVHLHHGLESLGTYGRPVETACHTWPASSGKRIRVVVSSRPWQPGV